MSFDPKRITKEHVLQAVEHINRENIELIPSTIYEVIINGEKYPPKEIMRYAHEAMNGEHIWENSGGDPTNKYLKAMGFEIIINKTANNPLSHLIQKYKKLLIANGFKGEEYKWQLTKKFHKRPDIKAPDFFQEITSINYSNLIYPVSKTVINHIAKEKPEEFRSAFEKLFDETEDLLKRVNDFATETLIIYRSIEPDNKFSHHQDERTISTYLAFYNNEKYPLFKDSFYRKFCKIIGIEPKSKNQKYIHYIQILNEFISDYILPDKELLEQKRKYLPEDSSEDKSQYLLAQDILFRTLDEAGNEEGVKDMSVTGNNIHLNTILYGPPGTGKTYNTIIKAANIVEGPGIEDYNEALKIFNKYLHDQIEFITFHQNYSYEDFVQGIRPDTENNKELTFQKKDGIFKVISDRALENIKQSEKSPEELSDEYVFENALNDFITSIENSKEDKYWVNKSVYISKVEEDAFRYHGANYAQENGWRMKFSDLKEFYKNRITSRKDIKSLENVSGLARGGDATYYYLVYEKILTYIKKSSGSFERIKCKNYVLIIDEINRANISRVFGELITLIEPDKRSHGKTRLKVKLPSGDEFMVPSNLYIIGTMNTADKSIALLDIALRRRFVFEPMYPIYDIKGIPIPDYDILLKINEQIIMTKGYDFQIGHAYFMEDCGDLVYKMNNKVLPLLLEYYMNDEKEVKNILVNAGLEIDIDFLWPIKISGRRDQSF